MRGIIVIFLLLEMQAILKYIVLERLKVIKSKLSTVVPRFSTQLRNRNFL